MMKKTGMVILFKRQVYDHFDSEKQVIGVT